MMKTPCPEASAVDAYFAGRSSPARQRALRPHLGDCPACRARFQGHLQLSRLDPHAMTFEERLGRALGVRPRPLLGLRAGWAAMAGAIAVTAGLLLVPGSPAGDSDGFQARGAGEPTALVLSLGGPSATDVLAFRTDTDTDTDTGQATSLATGHLPATAELAFAYRNGGGWQWLMVFARDELGNVYWYQPPWTDGRDDPAGVPLSTAAGLHELPKAVSHTFQGQRLTVCALATNQSLSVRQVERQLQTLSSGPPGALPAAAGGQIACRDLDVMR